MQCYRAIQRERSVNGYLIVIASAEKIELH